MGTTYSPHRSSGGTLHYSSPTHLHHVDPTAALRQLRRSLSRSPSRGPAFRLVTSKSPSPRSPLSPSINVSPSKLFTTTNLGTTSSNPTSPLAVPFPPSAKITRSASRRLSPMRPSTRSRTLPNSPAKRPLSDLKDNGNAHTGFLSDFGCGKENRQRRSISPTERMKLDKDTRMPDVRPPDSTNPAISRLEKETSSSIIRPTGTASPLKRSDGIMNLDQASLGSPIAKRRSLHGASFDSSFSIFDGASSPPHTDPQDEGVAESGSSSQQARSGGLSESYPGYNSNMPRRSSSLRKTTLQQRHLERPALGRSRPTPDSPFATPGQAASKSRSRLSLESNLQSLPRDSPFSSQGTLPNASVHPMFQMNIGTQGNLTQQPHQPHPLSKTMTQSSSGSSLTEESPTHVPVHNPDRQRMPHEFSRSLPVGASRPFQRKPFSHDSVIESNSSDSSFATPQNYKLVKPLPAAFMSTGLISKRNRNIDEQQPGDIESKQMPDTPCKKTSTTFGAPAVPVPANALHKLRQGPPEFGTPSTPFNPYSAKPLPAALGKGVSIFGNTFNTSGLTRRGSFISIDGEDNSQSPGNGESQSSTDFELPPTPTKQTTASEHGGSASAQRIASFQQPTSPEMAKKSLIMVEPQASLGQDDSSPLERATFGNGVSPKTPQDSVFPPDPSNLSISAQGDGTSNAPFFGPGSSGTVSLYLPATPTAHRDSMLQVGSHPSMTPLNASVTTDVDPSLISRFDRVELIGTGEFSLVYRVAQTPESSEQSFLSNSSRPGTPVQRVLPERVYAVKKSKQSYAGIKDRQRKLQEVNVLKALGQADHIVHFIDSWEERNYLYIQTEFCEEGSLDLFLAEVGRKARLDDFRIWKILLELSLGVKHIHDHGYIHLDLKPANILITFEGVLKIGDFGMATAWPAAPGIEGEGDREYIGPEILMGQYDKPADVFALGLIMLEIAGNVELPDNGPSWQKLRTGDMSDVPSLTWSSASSVFRDSSGNPLSRDDTGDTFYSSDLGDDSFEPTSVLHDWAEKQRKRPEPLSRNSSLSRRGELLEPPIFMTDAKNPEALERIVGWMISPQPVDRPLVDQVLDTVGVKWTAARRRAGATVFEGNWGPADEVLADDAEMIDV